LRAGGLGSGIGLGWRRSAGIFGLARGRADRGVGVDVIGGIVNNVTVN
jgi:hypothetical protein